MNARHHDRGRDGGVLAAVTLGLPTTYREADAARPQDSHAPSTAQAPTSTPPAPWAPTELPGDVYLIGCGDPEAANRSQPSAQGMGFKAWNLLRMAQLSLPVPAAFVIGTSYCANAPDRSADAMRELWLPGLQALERATGQTLGDARHPLLVSVRSGAAISMPGMMETLLDIGLCDATVAGMVRQTGNPRLVWDAYRRLVATYGEVVAGLPADHFERATVALFGTRDERDLDFAELRSLTRIARLGAMPSPPVALVGGDAGLARALREALTGLGESAAGRAALALGALERFDAMTDDDYAPVRAADATR